MNEHCKIKKIHKIQKNLEKCRVEKYTYSYMEVYKGFLETE